MPKKRKSGKGKRLISKAYVASAGSKKKLLMIKMLVKLFSDNTGIQLRDLSVDFKTGSLIMSYVQEDPHVANLKEITVTLLFGPEINKAIHVELQRIDLDIFDRAGNKKARVGASIRSVLKFNRGDDPLAFFSEWDIEKFDADFVLEEDLINQMRSGQVPDFIAQIKQKMGI